MKWINSLERRFGEDAGIPNLMYLVVLCNGITYFVGYYLNPNVLPLLQLHPTLLFQGELWRAITFVFIPPNISPFFLFITLYFYWMMGNALEENWGTFRFTLFYLIGMLGTLATVIVLHLMGVAIEGTGSYLNLSILLAFATLFPDYEILLFFVLPVKMRYVALFSLAMFLFVIVSWPLAGKAMAVIALANYLLFFGGSFLKNITERQKFSKNRNRFNANLKDTENLIYHTCTVCRQTEKDDPELEFRFCSCAECRGEREYCLAHLAEHKEKKQ